MHKSIDFAIQLMPHVKAKRIIVHGAFGGRMDQTLMSMFVLKQIYVQLEQSNPQPGKYIPLELILVDKFTKMVYL